MFHKAKTNRLCEDIVDQIKSLIENHKFSLGEKLPSETELAERFGVSRITVREAIRIMEILGLVKTYRGKGTIVVAVTSEEAKKRFSNLSLFKTKDMAKLLEVRAIIEPEVAARAARDASEEEISRIELALSEMLSDIEKGGVGAKGDIKFHNEICRSIKNDILSRLMESIMTMIEQSMHVTLNIMGRPKISYKEHLEILKAIRSHDSNRRAREAMRHHLHMVSSLLGYLEEVSED